MKVGKFNIEVGDRITFKACTRYSNNKVTRKVNGFWGSTDSPTVRYEGWSDFAVKPSEIIEVHPQGLKTYLMGDQPATCPICGARTEFVTLSAKREQHKCLDTDCNYQFILEDNSDE